MPTDNETLQCSVFGRQNICHYRYWNDAVVNYQYEGIHFKWLEPFFLRYGEKKTSENLEDEFGKGDVVHDGHRLQVEGQGAEVRGRPEQPLAEQHRLDGVNEGR